MTGELLLLLLRLVTGATEVVLVTRTTGRGETTVTQSYMSAKANNFDIRQNLNSRVGEVIIMIWIREEIRRQFALVISNSSSRQPAIPCYRNQAEQERSPTISGQERAPTDGPHLQRSSKDDFSPEQISEAE